MNKVNEEDEAKDDNWAYVRGLRIACITQVIILLPVRKSNYRESL